MEISKYLCRVYSRILSRGHACKFPEKSLKKGQKNVIKWGEKGQNIWKFGQKCTEFENILEKGRQLHEIIACNELL